MNFKKPACGLVVATSLALFSPIRIGAPDEIQVYTEDMNDPGEFGLELHVIYAIDLGIGHGLDNASDQWLAKAIIAFPFK